MLLRTRRILGGLILISLCALSSIALCSTEFETKLEQADALRSSDPKQFETLLLQLEAVASTATSDQLEQLRYLQAYRMAYSGQYNLAIQKASAIFAQSKNVTTKYRAGLLMTNSYAATRDYVAGFGILDKTLQLQDKIKDPEHRHDGLFIAALLYNQVGQYQLGKNYAEQILADKPTPRLHCLADSLRLESMYNLKSLPANDEEIEAMIGSCSDQHELALANFSRSYLARKWADQGGTKKAIKLLEQHIDETESSKFSRLIAEIHSLLAEYQLEDGNIARAEYHAMLAVKQSESLPFSLPRAISEKTLYEIALQRKDNAGALDHYKKYAEADKAYLNDVKARELAYQLVKQETQQKTQTIALLSKKNQVLQLEQTVAKQKAHYGALLLILLAALLAIIILWAYRTKRMQMAFRRLAETDALTGISNRDHFTKHAEQAISEAARKNEQLGLIMFDLDNFKSINDRYGHSTGDWVLKQVTEACKPVCRKDDCIGRIGGEEFAIVLHGSDLENAVQMAERFREQISSIDTGNTGHKFIVTASFGVTTTLRSDYAFDSLLSHADQALYQSKREGRNRVSVFEKTKILS